MPLGINKALGLPGVAVAGGTMATIGFLVGAEASAGLDGNTVVARVIGWAAVVAGPDVWDSALFTQKQNAIKAIATC